MARVLLVCLVVSSAMITKSSTAVLLTILLLYKLLRLAAVGLLASFSLVNNRDTTHKVSNMMWLVSTWGVQYTLVDMSFEQALTTFRPDRSQSYTTPVKAVKRTLITFLAGLIACSFAIFHAVIKNTISEDVAQAVSCDKPDFYFGYRRWYQLFLMTSIWMVPLWVITITFLVMAIHFLQKGFCNPDGRWGLFGPRPIPKDTYYQQMFVISLLGWHIILNLPLKFYMLLLKFTTGNPHVLHLQIGELCVIASTVTAPITTLMWPRFRAEAAKTLSCKSWKGSESTVSRGHRRSLPSMSASIW